MTIRIMIKGADPHDDIHDVSRVESSSETIKIMRGTEQ